MTYSTNPEQDAARLIDAAASEDEARQALSSAYKDQIMTAFTKDCIELGPDDAVLPYPKVAGMYFTRRYVIDEATELILDDKILPIFAKVLQYSDCHHVSELRKAMGEEYNRMWNDDLVEREM